MCAEHKKPRKLLKHLEAARAAGRAQRNPPRCLVFTNRVKTAKFVAKTLSEVGHRVALLHGQRPQNEREVMPLRLLLVLYDLMPSSGHPCLLDMGIELIPPQR